MATRDDLLVVMARHVGQANGITAVALAHMLDVPERRVRALVTEAREDGVAIAATPESGYFIAQTPEELEMCCAFLRSRAIHSLTLEARLRKISLLDLLGQLRLPT